MTVLNWGDLTKNQEDSETVEQAIARIIAEHNADAEAHLAEGQSLQSHKGAQIIDHLANSVVRDKLKFDRFAIDDLFATLDPWQPNGFVESMGYGDVQIFVGPTINQEGSMMLTEGEGITDQSLIARNPVWQIRLKFMSNTNQVGYIGPNAKEASAGYGFKIDNGTLKTFYFNGSGVEQNTTIGAITTNQYYVLSAEVSNGTDIKWYVDGTEVLSVSSISLSEATEFMAIYFKNTSAAYRIMHIQAFHYDADYIQ